MWLMVSQVEWLVILLRILDVIVSLISLLVMLLHIHLSCDLVVDYVDS